MSTSAESTPAAVIDPVAATASSKSIFPGPTAISSPFVMRRRN